ncbi:MAG: hypothetical protein GY913_02690, partial [Proteobacteria bacterium]|nr:hypothetical protein [Pseudomonadota bacterium]
SVIYLGGWPYQPDKDTLSEGARTWEATGGEVGDRLPRSSWRDQYGDTVDLYDFAGHDVPVMLSLCATWSVEYEDVAGLTTGGTTPLDYPATEAAIAAGEVIWLTVLTQDDAGNPPTGAALESWHGAHGGDGLPILADPGEAEDAWLVVGWPTLVLLDSGLTVESVRVNAWTDPLDSLESALSGQ